jgi:hypothetical protein
MTGIAIAASVLVYVWSMGFIGQLATQAPNKVALEDLRLDTYSWPTGQPSTLTLVIRNVGAANVTVDKVYISTYIYTYPAQSMSFTPSGFPSNNVPVGSTTTLTVITVGTSYAYGVAYRVKVATKTGGVYTFTCVYGKSG